MLGATAKTNPNPYFFITPQTSSDSDCVTVVKSGTCGSDFQLTNISNPTRVWCDPIIVADEGLTSGSAVPACMTVDYEFGAAFTPHITNTQNCIVDIYVVPTTTDCFSFGSGSGSSSPTMTVSLTGSGIGSSYAISVDKLALPFGDINTTAVSSPRSVTVTNTGTAPVTVNIADSDTMTFPYTPNITQTVIPVNGNVPFSVKCSTPTLGMHDETLTFSPIEGGSPQVVDLTCRGISTTVSETPNPVDFGNQLLGSAPADIQVMISSPATVSLSSFGFSTDTSPDISFSGSTSCGSTPCTVTVHYAATTPSDTDSLGTMMFTAAGTTVIHVPINGTLEKGSLGLNPASVDFGPICAGGSASTDVDVFATDEGIVTLSSLTAPTSPFSAVMSPTPSTDTTHHITLTASVAPPAGGATGDTTSNVVINTNIPGTPTYEVDLHTVVLPSGTSPTPDTVHFGIVPTGTPTSGKDIQITNCSGADSTLTGFVFGGDTPDEFKLVTPTTFPITVPSSHSQAFTLQMFPLTVGQKDATFEVDFASGSAVASLDGQAQAATGGGMVPRETYYACSTGHPTAAWPIGLALLALRRRRR